MYGSNHIFWVEYLLQLQKQPFQTLSQFDLNFFNKSKLRNTIDLIDKLMSEECSKEDFEIIFEIIYKKFQLDEMPEILYPLNSRDWIIDSLEDWAETFDSEDEEEEENAYDYIYALSNRYKNNSCSLKDYEEIIFHLWQKYDDEWF